MFQNLAHTRSSLKPIELELFGAARIDARNGGSPRPCSSYFLKNRALNTGSPVRCARTETPEPRGKSVSDQIEPLHSLRYTLQMISS